MNKLYKDFYLHPALDYVKNFLGKVLVHQIPEGRISGIITDVEAYPAFSDQVHHGNKKTPRTKIMWEEGGHAYVYVIYGTWSQFAAVVNSKDIPDVVFIRGIIPLEGKEIMKKQWNKPMKEEELANSPGKLCRSFSITKTLYGTDLTGDELFFEDWNIKIPPTTIQTAKRVGISSKHEGHDKSWRYFVRANAVEIPALPVKK